MPFVGSACGAGAQVRPRHAPADGHLRRGGGVVAIGRADVPQGAGCALREPAGGGQRAGHHVQALEHGVRRLQAQVEAGERAPARARTDWALVVPEVLVCALANIVGRIRVSRRVFDAQGDGSSNYKEMIMSLLTGAGLFNISDFVLPLVWLDV
ncbi:hypothetical protein TRIUR3_03645 [Triticum urartu]|uniref:Uncharacterized protein n=1 Tax=Triticum urartu TaxID=4572 RepID=M7YPQ5_TRIUA|nr:hypothetical protein TRIUR3_03645 [Triticum urartu]